MLNTLRVPDVSWLAGADPKAALAAGSRSQKSATLGNRKNLETFEIYLQLTAKIDLLEYVIECTGDVMLETFAIFAGGMWEDSIMVQGPISFVSRSSDTWYTHPWDKKQFAGIKPDRVRANTSTKKKPRTRARANTHTHTRATARTRLCKG